MKVFVAGATGAIGRPLVQRLLTAGHQVVGLTRNEDGASRLQESGAEPVVCDALDAERLIAAIVAAKPDAVVHQLTAIPDAIDPRKIGQQFEQTNRLRTEGTQNLIAGARRAGARQLLAQSVAFAYAPSGVGLKVEDDPLWADPPSSFAPVFAAIASLESQLLQLTGEPRGAVLRYGFLYGPGTAYAGDGSIARTVRNRAFPIVGAGDGMFSFIHVADAAAATVMALENEATGVYNIVDDEPAPARDWLPVYAKALDAPPPRRVPKLLGRLLAGPYAMYLMTRMRGASNAKAKAQLGWSPHHVSWRTGFLHDQAANPLER